MGNRTRKDRASAMNLDQLWYLKTGFYLDEVPEKDKFKGEKDMLKVWETHKDEILKKWKKQGRKKVDLWAWRHFEFEGGKDGSRPNNN